jgi:hypothetical protein
MNLKTLIYGWVMTIVFGGWYMFTKNSLVMIIGLLGVIIMIVGFIKKDIPTAKVKQ